MATKKMIVKCNCVNRIILEGYVHYKRFTTSEDGRKKLTMKLYTINLKKGGKESYVSGPIKVICYGNRAEEVNKFIAMDMLVEVEGRLRIPPDGADWIIMGVYVSEASPVLKQIQYEVDEEEESQSNDSEEEAE